MKNNHINKDNTEIVHSEKNQELKSKDYLKDDVLKFSLIENAKPYIEPEVEKYNDQTLLLAAGGGAGRRIICRVS